MKVDKQNKTNKQQKAQLGHIADLNNNGKDTILCKRLYTLGNIWICFKKSDYIISILSDKGQWQAEKKGNSFFFCNIKKLYWENDHLNNRS